MNVRAVVDIFSKALEVTGVGVIVFGALFSTGAAFWTLTSRRSRASFYTVYRALLSRAILLGLEFLVAADIISTAAVDLSYRGLGMLAVIVLVRTFLSFTIEVEVNGRWPWQQQVRKSKAEGVDEDRISRVT
jgi:uncharacterized membrane protein